jgi:uncharacterized surface anchored protein
MKKLLTFLALAAATVVYAGGISGQVVDAATGEPIAGAVVVAKSETDAGRAQTNQRGLYVIEGLEPGSYKVGAKARGCGAARYPGTVPVRGREVTEGIDFSLRRETPDFGAISGRITDRRTGEPVAGAVVVAADRGFRRGTRTNERGNYLIRGLKPGNYKVVARAHGYVREAYPRSVPVTGGNVTKDIDFALAPRPRPGAITGQVIDARTREPIADAIVIARGEGREGRAVTDRRGRYTLRLRAGEYRVAARARGYRPEVFPRPVPVLPGQVTKDIDFSLRRSRTLAD